MDRWVFVGIVIIIIIIWFIYENNDNLHEKSQPVPNFIYIMWIIVFILIIICIINLLFGNYTDQYLWIDGTIIAAVIVSAITIFISAINL